MAKKSDAKRDAFVSKKLAKMTLEEKVGQLLTFTWRGAMLTPSGIEQITKLHCGGLCLEPYALETCKNLYWGNSQVDQNFKKPKDYFTSRTPISTTRTSASASRRKTNRGAQPAAENRPEPAVRDSAPHDHRHGRRFQERLHRRRHPAVPAADGHDRHRRPRTRPTRSAYDARQADGRHRRHAVLLTRSATSTSIR